MSFLLSSLVILTTISGNRASSHASSALSTASLTAVIRARLSVSNPRNVCSFQKILKLRLVLVRCHLFCNAQFDTSTSGPPPSKTSGQQVTAVDWRGYLMFRQNFLVNTGNLETRIECKKEQENESDNHEQIEPTYDNAHPPNNNCSGCHS